MNMNTPENFSPSNLEKKEQIRDTNKRVLRAFVGGAVVAFGSMVGFGVIKPGNHDQKEQEAAIAKVAVEGMNPDQLFKYYESEVDAVSKVNYAAKIILDELKKPGNENGIALNSGNNVFGGNPRLDVSRDFLTKYMNAHSGGKFHEVWGGIIKSGVYTTSSLNEIVSKNTHK